jgi:hypothetical protein
MLLWNLLPPFSGLEEYKPSKHKLVPPLADRGCRVVSATDPQGR